MKLVKLPMVTDNQINNWMLSHIRRAMDCAIFQHEVDHLKMLYSKYKETNPCDSERFDDIAYCDKLLN